MQTKTNAKKHKTTDGCAPAQIPAYQSEPIRGSAKARANGEDVRQKQALQPITAEPDYGHLFCEASERVVLGNLLESPGLLEEIQGSGLTASHFGTSTHARIFDAISEMRQLSLPLDTYSLFEFLGSHASDLAALADIERGCIILASHARYHANIVIKKWRLRRLLIVAESLTESACAEGADPALAIDGCVKLLQQCEAGQCEQFTEP